MILENKKNLSERDICTKFITPAVKEAGWDVLSQIREEVSFTKGRIIVRGRLVTRGKAKRADYILYYKPNIPIALIEVKDKKLWGHGLRLEKFESSQPQYPLDLPIRFRFSPEARIAHWVSHGSPRFLNEEIREGSIAAQRR